MVEHLFCKQAAVGSSPVASSATRLLRASSRFLTSQCFPEGCPSGQREQTVNLPAIAYGGSNPPPSTMQPASFFAGLAQLVERQLSKLNVVGSNPSSRSEDRGFYEFRPDSSGVEHLLGKEEVVGSNPILGSRTHCSHETAECREALGDVHRAAGRPTKGPADGVEETRWRRRNSSAPSRT